MRLIAILLFTTLTINAQEMKTASETISTLFAASDNRDWGKVETIFAEQVELDYSSMNGNPAVTLAPKQITDAWKAILPGFTYTHHQVGNFITSENDNITEVFCYGTATHYLEDEGGNIWAVVGSYNFELKKEDRVYRVTKMKFNYKYQDGNLELPKKAIDNIKN